MGHYTAIKLIIRLKAETPKDIVSFFEQLMSLKEGKELKDFLSTSDMVDKLNNEKTFGTDAPWVYKIEKPANYPRVRVEEMFETHFRWSSADFEAWNKHSWEKNADGSIVLTTYASVKSDSMHFLKALFVFLKPYMNIEHGDVVAKTIYDFSDGAEVLWFDKEADQFFDESFCLYLNPESNPIYPGNNEDETADVSELDKTPDTVAELRKLDAENTHKFLTRDRRL